MQKQINEIMNWFPFDRVTKIMGLLDWNHRELLEGEIREKVRRYLEEAVERNESFSTWGFEITVDKDNTSLKLTFSPATWEAYEEEEDEFPFTPEPDKDKTLKVL